MYIIKVITEDDSIASQQFIKNRHVLESDYCFSENRQTI